MGKQYFTNPGQLCFGTSLANALVELEDIETAKKAYGAYFRHPLFDLRSTVNLGISPLMVRELTEGKYFGVLYAPSHWIQNFELFTKAEYGPQADELVMLIRKEFDSGNIHEIPRFGSYSFPLLMFAYNPSNGARHIITTTIDGHRFIDDGLITDCYPSGFQNVAGLEIHLKL